MPFCWKVYLMIFTSLNKIAGLLELNSMEDNSPAIRITTLYYSQDRIYTIAWEPSVSPAV